MSNRRCCCCCPNTNKTYSLEYNADRLAELTKKEQKRDNEQMEINMLPTNKKHETPRVKRGPAINKTKKQKTLANQILTSVLSTTKNNIFPA